MSRVAVLFANFGPYHLARLKAAASVCELLAIEVNHKSREYAWEPDAVASGVEGGFRRVCLERDAAVTVTSGRTPDGRKRGVLRYGLAEALVAFKPDVVAVPGWASGASLEAILWCRRLGVPAVVMSESQANDAQRSVVKEFVKRRVVRCFSAALVSSRSHRDYLMRLGMARDRIFSGYDAVDNEYFAREAERVRRENGKATQDEFLRSEKKDRRYFLAVARFIEKKNLEGLVRAYAEYRRCWAGGKSGAQVSVAGNTKDGPWDLVILGDGGLRSALERLVAELGLSGHVDLPGFKQYAELPKYYGSAGAFVHASVVEPWGLVVNEAMASGLPVLVSKQCGCAMELVRNGMNGFMFEPSDTAGLAALMAKVSAPEFPLREFGKESQRIIADWGVERFASGLEQAVEAAVGGSRRIGLIDYWMVGLVNWRAGVEARGISLKDSLRRLLQSTPESSPTND